MFFADGGKIDCRDFIALSWVSVRVKNTVLCFIQFISLFIALIVFKCGAD